MQESPRQQNYNYLPTEDEIEEEANEPCNWPKSMLKVARSERPKFIRMAAMFFLIAYVYSVLRDTKDAVIMERQEPASIAFLKTLYVTPASFVFVFVLQKSLNKHTVGNVLKACTIIFGVYFMVYSVILLPLQSTIEPSELWARSIFGGGKMSVRGLQPILALFLTVNFWTSSLLYVTAELWGNLVLSLLFMAFANDVCSFKQSLRFVPLFYVVSNIGLFLSGLSMLLFCAIQTRATYAIKKLVINAIFFLGGAACLGIYNLQRDLEKNVLPFPISQPTTNTRRRANKPKVGMAEGLKQMLRSRFLLQMCFIVLAYNICTNLIDTIFKCTMKAYAMAENEAVGASVMKTQAINQIVISTSVIILLSTPFARAVQLFGWRFAGMVTPVYALFCGCVVLALAIYNTGATNTNQLSLINSVLTDAPSLLWYEKVFGMLAAGGLKTAKYAAFDIALEALSMRIAKDERATAKGIYAGVCGKLGKTGGSVITIITLGLTNAIDLRSASQYCFISIIIMCSLWILSVKNLSNMYNESVATNVEIELDPQSNKLHKINKKEETEKQHQC